MPISTFAYGEEIRNEPSVSPDQKSKIRLQMAEMKKEIGKLSDRAAAAKHRYVDSKNSHSFLNVLYPVMFCMCPYYFHKENSATFHY